MELTLYQAFHLLPMAPPDTRQDQKDDGRQEEDPCPFPGDTAGSDEAKETND